MRGHLLAMVSTTLVLSAQSASATEASSRSRTWVEQPWGIRYVLFSAEAHRRQSKTTVAREFNAEQEAPGKDKIYLSAAALLEPTTTLAVPGAQPIAVVVLAFDYAGHIVNHKGALGKMSAKRNMLDVLVLINDDAPGARPYDLADWWQGIPVDVTFSPAVCNSYDDRYRYTDDWSINNPAGNFGCREWTAQLYAREQPYIDVTSYLPRGTFIGELIGWSRFEDPPKPVIGRHGNTWLCLHKCPTGEKPGVIADIKAWTAKYGYPMPERPRKQPLYPNANYTDDLNE